LTAIGLTGGRAVIRYFDLGGHKSLNDVVFAGSHDAGITFGSSNVQTQNLDILGQAKAGVRLFDLRIAAAAAMGKQDGVKNAQLRAFHADGMLKKDETKTRFMPELGRNETVTRTALRGGGFGMSLQKILIDARTFVSSTEGGTECLMLKFDKCTNWSLIAEACVSVLGDTLYKGGGNLNKKTLQDLKGKVIPLFMPDGLQVVQKDFKPSAGILGITNLAGGGTGYNELFDGVQYFGKGGTSPFNPRKKMSQNQKKQAKLMAAGGHGNPNVMGMMYWTTTGLKESIYKRDKGMWTEPNKAKLKGLWRNGMEDAVKAAAPKSTDFGSYAAGPVIKTFMPNFIMIDFADDDKCQTIYDLNVTPPHQFVELDEDEDELVALDEF
jgi:hypothetical protein